MSELSLVLKATAILAAGLCASAAARRTRASLRHAILGATLLAVLLLPAVSLLTPGIPIEVPMRAVPVVATASFLFSPSAGTTVTADPTPRSSPSSPQTPRWGAIVRTVWIAGTVAVVLSLCVSLWRFRQLRRLGLPWNNGFGTVAGLASAAGIDERFDVVLHEGLAAPATCGWRRATVLLPADAPDWPDADVRRALLHELEHVRRGDWGVHLMARTACAVFWFHPLAWLAFGRLALEAERACDDAVLKTAGHADYAEQLVQLARRMSKAPAQPLLAMARRSDLATRVSAILDQTQSRGRLGALPVGVALACAMAVVSGVAPLRAVGARPGPVAPAAAQEVRSSRPRLEVRLAASLDRALLEAASEGDVELMTSLVASGANVNGVVRGDGSPLIAAARAGRLEAVRWLLDHGADPNFSVSGDGNPLIMAAQAGRTTTVDFLLSRGADIERVVDGDENPLITASAAGQLEVVRLLVARGANVNARVWVEEIPLHKPGRPEFGGEWRSPLSMAQRRGHTDVVRYLRSAGAQD